MRDVPILKIENLGHSYGKYLVIQDISLEVDSGEMTALIGPNGAGKTTFSSHPRPRPFQRKRDYGLSRA